MLSSSSLHSFGLLTKSLKRPHAVLFDYDGVLVASETIHFLAWKQLLEGLKLPFDTDLLHQSIGKTAPQILAILLEKHRPGWDPLEFNIAELAQRKSELYLPLARSQLQPYPGVIELLEWLKSQGIPMAVVSNARSKELKATLKTLHLFPYFQEVVSREDVPAPKPDPTPYLFAAATLGVDPLSCLAIEDSPPGLEAALIAKIPAAAVLTTFLREALEHPVPGRPNLKPHWIGPSIQELGIWIRGLAA